MLIFDVCVSIQYRCSKKYSHEFIIINDNNLRDFILLLLIELAVQNLITKNYYMLNVKH